MQTFLASENVHRKCISVTKTASPLHSRLTSLTAVGLAQSVESLSDVVGSIPGGGPILRVLK